MKKAIFVFFLLAVATSIEAQTVTLGPITKLSYCVGDTVSVPYTTQGTFNAGNVFKAQLSEANGSFATFNNFGQDSNLSGLIPIVITNAGSNYHVRVISTNPYRLSDTSIDSIQVLSYPAPQPSPSGDGFAGDPVIFDDGTSELPGSTYQWTFNQDASTDTSSVPSVKVVYAKEGIKTGKLTVTNSAGCSATVPFSFRLVSCSPLIPKNVHVVTGTETGSDTAVWVMPGGNYTTSSEGALQTVFAEPGSAVIAAFRTNGLYYMKTGSSFVSNDDQGSGTVIVDSGTKIPSDPWNPNHIDYCHNLNFDYSLLPDSLQPPPASVLQEQPVNFSIVMNHLILQAGGMILSARIFSVLGNELLSKRGAGTLDLDLSPLPAGVYFAIVQAGDTREVRRIAVVH